MKINSINLSGQYNAFPAAEGDSASSFLKVKKNENFSSKKNTALTFRALNTGKVVQSSDGILSNIKGFFAKHFMKEAVVVSDYSKFKEETNMLLGNGFLKNRIEEFQNLMGQDASRFLQIEDNKLTIYDRKVSGKLLSGILDVAWLPVDILNAGINGVCKIPGIKGTKFSDTLKNIPFVKKRADNKAAMELFYRLKGAASNSDNPFKIREAILSITTKDSVGNYNTKDERALNRLVTGAVSSIFVGMDFYNLVMYQKNNKEEAEKAAKKRRRREFTRIAINAFMTYSILGALSSYANKSKAFACAAIAGSTLFAEVATRLISGVPLVPLTPEGAKKYNEERLKKQTKNKKIPFFKNNDQVKQPPEKEALNHKTKDVFSNKFVNSLSLDNGNFKVFDKFTNSYNSLLTGRTKFNNTDNNDKQKEIKSPITLKRLAIAALAAGVVNILFTMARSKSVKLNSFMTGIQENIAKFYDKYAKEDLIVNAKDLRKLLDGFDGNSSSAIKDAYSRVLDVKFTTDEADKLLKEAKNGIIKIKNDNEIFSNAFKRSSNKVISDRVDKLSLSAPDMDYTDVTRAMTKEITDTALLHPVSDSGDKFVTYQKFKNIAFQLDLDNPEIIDGVKYYGMKNAEYNFGRTKDSKIKVLIDAAFYPFKAVKTIITTPGNILKKLIKLPAGKELKAANKEAETVSFSAPDIGELYKDCLFMFKKYDNGKISKEEFSKYIDSVNTKLLNTDTAPSYPQTALASLSRNFVTLITSYFFINDFRNEVLIQSNGENTTKAKEVTNERIAHKLSNFVLNKFFMELFNNTFQKQYLGSLLGATTVAAATELTNESCVRLSIGVPIGNKNSREEIEEFERKHLEQKGLKGAYYRLMARLTGKKMLSEKAKKG